MRFIILVKATPGSEAETTPVADDALLEAMTRYHEQLARAGALLDAGGLQPSRSGWRIRYAGGRRTEVIDGPFAETKELVAGYTVIEVKSREEALEWARRFPAPMGAAEDCEIEVRQLCELDELGAGDTTERLRRIGL